MKFYQLFGVILVAVQVCIVENLYHRAHRVIFDRNGMVLVFHFEHICVSGSKCKFLVADQHQNFFRH